MVVFPIGVHVDPPLVEDSHLLMLPVFPLNVNVPLFVPEQTAELVPTVPPTETGFTVIVATDEFAALQTPL